MFRSRVRGVLLSAPRECQSRMCTLTNDQAAVRCQHQDDPYHVDAHACTRHLLGVRIERVKNAAREEAERAGEEKQALRVQDVRRGEGHISELGRAAERPQDTENKIGE